MKEPINRLPGPGFGSDSIQRYPSAKQHRNELSIFISPHPLDRQSLRGERQIDLSNTKTQRKIYGTLNSETVGVMPNPPFLPAQLENTIRLLQSIHQKTGDLGELV